VRARRGGGLSSYFGGDAAANESAAPDVLASAGVTGRAGSMSAVESVVTDILGAIGSVVSTGVEFMGLTPTIYAAPTALGNGSGTSRANAMALSTALATAGPGSIIGVLAGIYTGTPSGVSNRPIFQPAGSGNSTTPLIIVAQYPAAQHRNVSRALLSEFRSSAPFTDKDIVYVDRPTNENRWAVNNPVFGLVSKTNVLVIGLFADMQFAPPRPSNGTFLMNQCAGCTFSMCAVDQVPVPDLDNYNALFDRGNTDCTVTDFLATGGAMSAPNNHNASVITAYGAIRGRWLRVTGVGVNCLLFMKGSHNGIGNSGLIQYCKSTGASQSAIEVSEVQPGGGGIDVLNNLSIRDNIGFKYDDAVAARCTDIRVRQNTFVDSVRACILVDDTPALTNCVQMDNVCAFTAPTSARVIEANRSVAPITSNNNLFFEQGGDPGFSNAGSDVLGGLPGWQAATSKDLLSTQGPAGFQNAANDDYRRFEIDSGSSVGGRRGSYVTNNEAIGVQ
jgi:hypothetical protein